MALCVQRYETKLHVLRPLTLRNGHVANFANVNLPHLPDALPEPLPLPHSRSQSDVDWLDREKSSKQQKYQTHAETLKQSMNHNHLSVQNCKYQAQQKLLPVLLYQWPGRFRGSDDAGEIQSAEQNVGNQWNIDSMSRRGIQAYQSGSERLRLLPRLAEGHADRRLSISILNKELSIEVQVPPLGCLRLMRATRNLTTRKMEVPGKPGHVRECQTLAQDSELLSTPRCDLPFSRFFSATVRHSEMSIGFSCFLSSPRRHCPRLARMESLYVH